MPHLAVPDAVPATDAPARPEPAAGRDELIDVVRAGSLVVVVAYHWLFTVVRWFDDGPHASNPIGSTRGLWLLTWVLQVMPLFFVVGGAVHARSSDRGRTFVVRRLQRLVPPAAVLVGVVGGLGWIAGPVGGVSWAPQAALLVLSPLWFLAVYALLVLLTPVARWAHGRWGEVVPVALLVAVALIDLLRFRFEVTWVGWLSWIAVFGFCHQVGFSWDRLRAASSRTVDCLLVGGLGAMVVLTNLGPYPRSTVGVPGEAISNMGPPTVVIAALCCLQVGLLAEGRSAPPGRRRRTGATGRRPPAAAIDGALPAPRPGGGHRLRRGDRGRGPAPGDAGRRLVAQPPGVARGARRGVRGPVRSGAGAAPVRVALRGRPYHVRVLADGPRRGLPIRSATKLRRRQRTLGAILALSLVAFACVNDRLTGPPTGARNGDGDEVATAGGGDSTGSGSAEGGSDDGGGSDGGGGDAPQGPFANESDFDGWVDPASSGNPWTTEPNGLLTFRGNPTRSWYGAGPVPTAPEVVWSLPEGGGGFCGESAVGGEAKTWCGTGWTGQPSVWEDGDTTWVAFGAYDKNVHFLDGADGTDLIGAFDIGDIVKGSVTRDPDGFPLLYSGSRADFHVIATDREQAESLWSMDADEVSPTKWNNDWDSSPLVIDDYLFEGGENGQWYVIKLNRSMGDDGLVAVAPEVVFHAPGWDDELLSDLSGSGSRVDDVSIENSLAISGDTVYFTNSGGLVQGWDISGLAEGADPTRTFRFWTGDDTDASIVIDDEGMLYVSQEVERSSSSARHAEVGQLLKLDPSKPDDPLVWSVEDPNGLWATPALAGGIVIAPTDGGRIVGVDQETGDVLWEKDLPGPTWSSPVVVDDVWIQGDCNGVLHGFDLADPTVDPPELWTVQVEGCIESTPAVWDGRIYVGARGGRFYAIADA